MIHATLMSEVDEDICLMLRFADHKWSYLCDCGRASRLTFKDCRDTNAIFVSHAHIDHFSNFDMIFRHQLAVGRKITICGPPGLAKQVHHKLCAYTWNLRYDDKAVYYEVRELHEDARIEVFTLRVPAWEAVHTETLAGPTIYETDAFTVRATLLDHGTPCAAYLFEEPGKLNITDFPYKPGKWIRELKEDWLDGQRDVMIDVHGEELPSSALFSFIKQSPGYRLGFIMDHLGNEANHQLIERFFHGVDALYIESYYRHEDLELALQNHHSTATLSGEVARKAQAKEVHPVHYSRRYNGAIEDLKAECFAAFCGDE